MDQERRILIPLDGSEFSRWVLDRARPVLERRGVSVTVAEVVEAPEERAHDLAFVADSRHDDLCRFISSVHRELMDRSIPTEGKLLFGDPAREITREAGEGGYDLIVMATHGRTGMGRVLFGSVAHKVILQSPVPVLLFRPLQRADGTLSPIETREPVRFRKILVPLDGTPQAEEILPVAETFASTFGAKLYLLRAVPGGAQEGEERRSAEEYLRNWERKLISARFVTHVAIRTGPAGEAVVAHLREHDLDLVAMTTRGRSGLARALYGSVAERVLRDAPVPLLALRSGRSRLAPTPPDSSRLFVRVN